MRLCTTQRAARGRGEARGSFFVLAMEKYGSSIPVQCPVPCLSLPEYEKVAHTMIPNNFVSLSRLFREEEIGSRMSAAFIAIPVTATVKEAMSLLIRQAAEIHNIAVLYSWMRAASSAALWS